MCFIAKYSPPRIYGQPLLWYSYIYSNTALYAVVQLYTLIYIEVASPHFKMEKGHAGIAAPLDLRLLIRTPMPCPLTVVQLYIQ